MEDLRVIVQRMIDAGEPEENIKIVIERYKAKRQQDIQDPFLHFLPIYLMKKMK